MPPKRAAYNSLIVDASVMAPSRQNTASLANMTIGMNSTLSLRTSRSGRTIIPRLKTWAGERVVVNKNGTLQYFEGGPDLTGTLENERTLYHHRVDNSTLQHFTITDCQIMSQAMTVEEMPPPKRAPRRRQKQVPLDTENMESSTVVAAAGPTSRKIVKQSVQMRESAVVTILDSTGNSTQEDKPKKPRRRRARLTMPKRKPVAWNKSTALIPSETGSAAVQTRGRNIRKNHSTGETTLAVRQTSRRSRVADDSYEVGTLPIARAKQQKTVTTTAVNQFTVASRSTNLTSDSAYMSMTTPTQSVTGRSFGTRQLNHLSGILEESASASPVVTSTNRRSKKQSLPLAIAATPGRRSGTVNKKTPGGHQAAGIESGTPTTARPKSQPIVIPSPTASPVLGRKPRRLLNSTVPMETTPVSPVLNGTVNRSKATRGRRPNATKQVTGKPTETEVQPAASKRKKADNTSVALLRLESSAVNDKSIPRERKTNTTKGSKKTAVNDSPKEVSVPSPQRGRKRKTAPGSDSLLGSTQSVTDGKTPKKKTAGRVPESPKRGKQTQPDDVFLKPVALPPSKSRSRKPKLVKEPLQTQKLKKSTATKTRAAEATVNNSKTARKSPGKATLTSKKQSKLPLGSTVMSTPITSPAKRSSKVQCSPVVNSKSKKNTGVDDSFLEMPSTSYQRPRTVKERQLQMRNLQCPLDSSDSSDEDDGGNRSSRFARQRPDIFGGPTRQIAAMLDLSSSDSDDNLSIRTASSPYSSRSNVSMTSVVNTSERLSDDFESNRINDSRTLAEKLLSYGHAKVLHRQLKPANETSQPKHKSAPNGNKKSNSTKGKSLVVKPAAPNGSKTSNSTKGKSSVVKPAAPKKPVMEYSCLYNGNKVDVSCWDTNSSDEEGDLRSFADWMDRMDD